MKLTPKCILSQIGILLVFVSMNLVLGGGGSKYTPRHWWSNFYEVNAQMHSESDWNTSSFTGFCTGETVKKIGREADF